MSDIIKMNYPLMEEMSQSFLRGVEQLQDTMQAMQTIATELEDGALLSRGGEAFTDAIRGRLCPRIAKLTDKLQELSMDVQRAMHDMQDADRESEGKF